MTKNFGQDFDFDHPSHSGIQKPAGLRRKLIPKLFDFLMPIAIGLLAVYVGRYGFNI